jgi:uncharacterized protein YndB with AHSA1/START domain
MVAAAHSATIHRPIEEVFAYVTNTGNDPAWHTDILEAHKETDGPIGIGTVWTSRFKPSMGISEGEMEVVEFEPNRKEVMRGEIGPMRPTLTYLFEPADEGTRFTRRIQIKVSGVMKVMAPVMSIMTRKSNRDFLANLKRVLEQQRPPG